jgi:carbamoyl-phosphate synthase large subunit
VDLEKQLQTNKLSPQLVKRAKEFGFTDGCIARLTNKKDNDIRTYRLKHKIIAQFKTVDTCACEFDAHSAYYYSSYDSGNEVDTKPTKSKKILIIGSGPIRIGQGIEFDYCSVHCI